MGEKTQINIVEPIKGFEDYYINEAGDIYSYKNCTGEPKKLQPFLNRYGYLIVTLYGNKKSYTKFVHRLLAETFIPNPENLPTVDHINRIKTDNRLENLRWASRSTQQLNQNVKGYSKYRGVSFNKASHKWEVHITVNKKNIYLGVFVDEIDAAKAFDEYVKAQDLPQFLNFS